VKQISAIPTESNAAGFTPQKNPVSDAIQVCQENITDAIVIKILNLCICLVDLPFIGHLSIVVTTIVR
jgi:hypothetical protein